MNLLLFSSEECEDGVCTVRDARAAHLRDVLRVAPGDRFQAGVVDGPIGVATVTEMTEGEVRFTFAPEGEGPKPWYDLVLALTRPRSLRRILSQSATLGVRTLFLVGAEKVEKSYFNMHLLRPEEYRPLLLDGLMQGKATALPRVRVVPRLRALWNELPEEGTRLLADPAPETGDFALGPGAPVIAIGPDGGWTDAERAAFAAHGFAPVSLGPRPLRTDTAAIVLPAVVGHWLHTTGRRGRQTP